MTLSLSQTIQHNIENKIFPGVALLAGRNESIDLEHYQGSFTYDSDSPLISQESIFDLASLTKAICTTSLCMKVFQEGSLKLTEKIGFFFPELSHHSYTVKDLLNHRSGLKDRLKFFMQHDHLSKNRQNFLQDISREGLIPQQQGTYLYSDLNFILLGWILEDLFQKPLDLIFQEHLEHDLKLNGINFNPLASQNFVPTEFCPWRKKLIAGEVHDDNAYIMNGVAGHAGLFANLKNVGAWIQRILQDFQQKKPFFTQNTWNTFTQVNPKLGWDHPSGKNSLAGQHFSPQSIGHLAFTGCSFWIDLQDGKYILLLSNRTFPLRSDKLRFNDFRRDIHNLICEEYFL